MSRHLILVGNYGAGNIGDDALCEYFQGLFAHEQLQIVSATSFAGSLPRLPCGLRSFFCPWWKTLFAIARAKALVFGGGTLFTDTESIRACILWWMYAVVARIFRRPIFLAFQGVGPFRTRLGCLIARWVYRSAVFVSVRDGESFRRVQGWGLKDDPVLTFDPAFVRFRQQQKRVSDQKILVLIPRHNSGSAFIDASLATLTEEAWDRVLIVLMDPCAEEMTFALKLYTLLPQALAEIVPIRSVPEFLDTIARASRVVAERFHGLLAATALEIPFTLISRHPGDKFSTLAPYSDPEKTSLSPILDLVEKGGATLMEALKRTT